MFSNFRHNSFTMYFEAILKKYLFIYITDICTHLSAHKTNSENSRKQVYKKFDSIQNVANCCIMYNYIFFIFITVVSILLNNSMEFLFSVFTFEIFCKNDFQVYLQTFFILRQVQTFLYITVRFQIKCLSATKLFTKYSNGFLSIIFH